MRHIVAAGFILVLFAGGFLVWGGGSGGDLLAERDRFFREEALVVEFAADVEGGGQADPHEVLTYLEDDAWIFGTTLRVGAVFFSRVAEGCALPAGRHELPLLPGISVAPTLLSGVEVEERDGGIVRYAVGPEGSPAVEIEEDLSALRSHGQVRAHSRGSAPGAMNGTIIYRRASDAERESASLALLTARASETTTVSMRTRLLRREGAGDDALAAWNPQDYLVLRDCPEALYFTTFDSTGGAEVPAGTTGLTLAVTEDGVPSVLDVISVSLPLEADDHELLAAVARGDPGEVPLRPGEVFVSAGGESTDERPRVVYEITGCVATPWFRCDSLTLRVAAPENASPPSAARD